MAQPAAFPAPTPPPESDRREAARQGRACLNCGTSLTDAFCAHCGQRAGDARLSLRDLLHELAAEHFGLDTKVARTLGTLVRYPGRLTIAFIAGRRVRYLPPLRLYLSLSVLFFLASAFARSIGGSDTNRAAVRISPSGSTHAAAPADSSSVATTLDSLGFGADSAKFDRVSVDTTRGNAFGLFIKRRLNQRVAYVRTHKTEAKQHISEAFRHDLPDALFLLVPGLALALSMLYYRRHRYYTEHLVFALHFQSFSFAALTVALVPIPMLSTLMGLAIIGYLFVALRTVYGGGIVATAAKLALIVVGYGVSLVAIIVAVGFSAFLFA
jgi:hypothetical protein